MVTTVGIPPVLDQVKVASGYELALAAALGDDLDAPVAEEGPARWSMIGGGDADAGLPKAIEPLAAHVVAPPELARRLKQIGVVDPADGRRLQRLLKPGQRLVSVEGDTAFLQLGGGCQGCGMATVTLRQGIEVAIMEAIPEIKHVIDVTDHASGENPYFH